MSGHIHARSFDDAVAEHLALRNDPRRRISGVRDRGDSVAQENGGHPVPEMNMAFKQSGKDRSAVGLNDPRIRWIGDLAFGSHSPNAVAFHDDDRIPERSSSRSVNQGAAFDD